ncbi:MAG: hypothetical protein CMA41_02570 [Euryarchaeota archaeon]|jgi:copper chaperone CopZ|nr:hypothetical protein [Euryarchaeota archaeon]CAI8266213.1 MAG: Mercuric reductase [Euryarchaeota archaeon UBA443]|tara:strand:- start:76 stop:288 length:213 start_codon:yes stop_codon:yes gene_type:complete
MNQVAHALKITGMTCGCCSGRVTRVLEATPGVIRADISWQNHAGIVVTTSDITTEQVMAIVASTGFGVSA